MSLPNSKIIPILRLIREKLPTVGEISGFMSIADTRMKSDDAQRKRGFGRL